ncbi:histidine kinase [Egicoccus sp. AB-alg2]|uniref:histidine kinase n=1 Tax=Egicoccus sp. AB-alg2 TaxID=3242693 RepID=UPI00359EAE74
MPAQPREPDASWPRNNGAGTPGDPAAPPVDLLDSVQQRLFVVALGLNGVRNTVRDGTVAEELDRLEALIDDVIRDVRAGSAR